MMNKTTLTLLSTSCMVSLLVLMSHTAVAETRPTITLSNSTPQNQQIGTVASPINTSATQTIGTAGVQVNPRVFSLDPNSDTVGNVAIAKFGCDCSSCRALALRMLQTGQLTLCS
ncbi:MAG: hypothetical protein V7L29_32045 [Nostoc sp.]|uniref:hypothetical protein n=1 Tax=Nostoc sp. TaxID=1180 RepID=UPI002FFD0087